uniref:DUF2442 domain-containing protein n=1 Tax=Candidatus Kentrum sp. FW TaxID=2126338 RepID=A0A450U3Z8_9GAMM|nr:MAG: Protein of unknown function (DUF2442) [Candidatus Kentron sp. FW]
MLSINDAKYAGEYNIRLAFNNGMNGTANLKKTVFSDKREIFLELREKSKFQNFKVEHDTVVWFNELDLAPEFLYFLTFKEDEKFQDQFRSWGYIA